MRLIDMLEICLVFLESEPQYAYKPKAYQKNVIIAMSDINLTPRNFYLIPP